jgi:hypothetical protein
MRYRDSLGPVPWIIAMILLFCCQSFAHDYHTSLTRIDHDAKEGLLEITVRVFDHDLEAVLAKKAGARVNIGDSKDSDALIFDYVEKNLIVRDAAGSPLKLEWVGKEMATDIIYLYIEARYEGDPAMLLVADRLFCEEFPEQVNLLQARYSGFRSDLVFKPGDGFKQLGSGKKNKL